MRKTILFFVLFCALSGTAVARNVLFLYSNSPDLPWVKSLNQGIEEAMSIRPDWTLYSENLDVSRLGVDYDEAKWVRYLAWKYGAVRFDIAFAESAEASELLNAHGRELFGDIPIVLYSSTTTPSDSSIFTMLSQSEAALSGTYRMAMEQNPGAKYVMVVNNTSIYDNLERNLHALAKADGLEVMTLSHFALEALLEKAGSLPANGFVVYFPVYADDTGERLVPYRVLEQFSARARVPVYTLWSSLLGTGAVGGRMIDAGKTASEMFRLAETRLATDTYDYEYETVQSFADWKAMKRLGLSTKGLPPNVVVVNKPISPFTVYRTEILSISLAVLALFLLMSLIGYRLLSNGNQALRRMNEELEEARAVAESLARHDALTGLMNRRALMDVVNDEIERVRRTGAPLSALLLDVDHFKAVNDRYGHEAGDRALALVARILNSAVRRTDRVARWGGEEFLVLSPDTDAQQAWIMAEKVRRAVEAQALPGGPVLRVSGGVGQLDGAEGFHNWFVRIDAALYRAKSEGRNRICVAGETLAPDQAKHQA